MTATAPTTVEVPDIGDFTDVPIIEVHVTPGEPVAVDDPIVTLESDKATMDVPAPVAGRVAEVLVSLGDQVSQGTPLITLEPTDAAEAEDSVESAIEAEVSSAPDPEPASPDGAEAVYASPSIRRLARELGVDLAGVSGSGRKGRITREDVEQVGGKGPASAAPAGPVSGPPPATAAEERVPLKRIQKIAAPRLTQSWTTIPHVTHHDEADITELEAWRKELNAEQPDVKVTMVSFLVIASVATLKRFPEFNSSLDGDELILKHYFNIGFAADTPGGLVVPVIKDADQKGLLKTAGELTELSEKARAGKLTPAEMSGGTFTISSLGGIGGTGFTPIVYAPQVAILGVTRAAMKPVWDGREFAPRLMLPLSLSYDHRVIDGAAAARFVVHLAGVISDLRRVLL